MVVLSTVPRRLEEVCYNSTVILEFVYLDLTFNFANEDRSLMFDENG